MKRLSLLNLLFTGLMLVIAFSSANGQPGGPPPDGGNQFAPQNRPKLLEELSLTKAQIQSIRRINQEFRPLMQESKRRWDMANMELDRAIYNDTDNENEIQARLREAQIAHSELIKNKTMQETAIRRILTPAQLVRFRQLREEFDLQKREMNNQNRPANNPQQIPNRLKNLPKRQILRQQQRPLN